MRAISFPRVAVLAIALIQPVASSAQQERIWRPSGGDVSADIVLYRNPNFGGTSVRAQTAVPDLGLAWQPRSVRVELGAWQLCRGVSYTGRCFTVRGDMPTTTGFGVIRSARPIRTPTPRPDPDNAGPSLRGMAAEFFTQPSANGARVVACLNANASMACARRTAEGFCRSRGYNYVGNVAMETVDGRVYLADVLCRRSAG